MWLEVDSDVGKRRSVEAWDADDRGGTLDWEMRRRIVGEMIIGTTRSIAKRCHGDKLPR
jgi:hypothetical protein